MTDQQSLNVVVAGASGMIGTEVCRQLAAAGHTVRKLVRAEPSSADQVSWNPAAHIIDDSIMDTADAVINLSGASLSRLPWTRSYQKEILASRISATETLTEAMRTADRSPAVFASGSAVGIYGDRGDQSLDEGSSRGSGFLADVVDAWEQAAHLAPETTRVATVRTGLVVGHGGAMKALLPIAKLGFGGPLGTGRQFWPWVSLHDEAAAIVHILTSELAGAVNVVGPTPATSAELIHDLTRALHRPYGFPAPRFLIRTALGDAGDELLLASQKVTPRKLLDDGFTFRDRSVDQAIGALVDR